jgi:hypothetical protein
MAPGGVSSSSEFSTRTITGTGSKAAQDTLVMPCEGRELSGEPLAIKLQEWVTAGVMEGDVAVAVAALDADPALLAAARSKVRAMGCSWSCGQGL